MHIDVALPLPIPRTFTYSVEADADAVEPGTRVLVPFGRRKLVGWVVTTGTGGLAAGDRAVRPILRLLDSTPSVPADLLALCRWVADYYVAPLGLVLRAALPTLLTGSRGERSQVRTRWILRLTRELPSLRLRDELFGRAQRQRECYEAIEALGGSAEVAHLTRRLGFASTVVRGLVNRGLADLLEEEAERDPFGGSEPAEPLPLSPTAAQAEAIQHLVSAARSVVGQEPGAERPFLLRGVTGSGKTFVYIELLREVVENQGRGAIMLVPEIALTPQTVGRFRAHFGDRVAVLHSGLSDGERYDAWRALRSGRRRIAIGARSAVFAPVPDLGAIILDEEHENTYKQSDAEPRYHARDVAIMRARLVRGICLLGSATPSLESWHNAGTGKFALLELPDRVENRPLPPVRILDLRQTRRSANSAAGTPQNRPGPPPLLAPELVDALADRLARGEQCILLLNRRGYAAFVQCFECGEVLQCERCSVSLTFHRLRRRLLCHYCAHEEPPPTSCPNCGGEQIAYRGSGTEQVERAVADRFPAARIARMDVDTTSGRWAHHRILGRFERHEIDILLGTQMIAKGLDFPGVTLVGIVNADVGLNLPDFRASERSFQLLTQVAGRAGRGSLGGTVLVQTAMPNSYAVRTAAEHDFVAFAEREMDERRGPPYPPFCRLANIVVSGLEQVAVQQAAAETATRVRQILKEHGFAQVELVGPAPCPIDRIRRRWRWHFLLRSPNAAMLGNVCRLLYEEQPVRPGAALLRLLIDRDPVALL